MAKREITAKEAAKRLKAFGFKVGTDKDGKPIKPSWTAIDTFVKNNPKAKSVLKANKGAFVQRRSGFSNGGITEKQSILLKTANDLKAQKDAGKITMGEYYQKLNEIPIDSDKNITGVTDNIKKARQNYLKRLIDSTKGYLESSKKVEQNYNPVGESAEAKKARLAQYNYSPPKSSTTKPATGKFTATTPKTTTATKPQSSPVLPKSSTPLGSSSGTTKKAKSIVTGDQTYSNTYGIDKQALEDNKEAVKEFADLYYLSMQTGVDGNAYDAALKKLGINTDEAYAGAKTNIAKDILKAAGYSVDDSINFYGNKEEPKDIGAKILKDRIADLDKAKANLKPGQVLENSNVANSLYLQRELENRGLNFKDVTSATYRDDYTLDTLPEGDLIFDSDGKWTGKTTSPGLNTDNKINILEWDVSDPPLGSTPRRSAPAPDMPAAISLEPSQEEIDRAAEIFSKDGTVTLPTGSYDLPSIETPTIKAPEGTTAVDSPTFEGNIDRQTEQFRQRAKDQAQLIQPQTRAEKIAAGQNVGKLEQRLYQNRQGMSTYVLGVYNSEGVWTPSQPIPQGYRVANVGLAPYLVRQAAEAPKFSDIESDETGTKTPDNIDPSTVVNPEYGKPQFGMGNRPVPKGYYSGPADGVHKYGEGPYAEQTQAFLDSIGMTFEEYSQSKDTYYQGGMIRGYDNGGMPETFNTDTFADRFPVDQVLDSVSNVVPDNATSKGDETKTPTVTVAGEPLTKEQVAQGQADLTAGAVLDPAGTVVAAPVSQINPDAEGTVLGATTGQALGTAPIITDPAQVDKTVTADTPTKPDVTKVTTQKAEDKIKTALEGGLDVQKMLDNVKGSSFYKPEYNPETGKITIEEPRLEKMVVRIDEDGNEIPQEPLPPVKREVTPEEFADMFGANVADFTSEGVQAATSTGPTKEIEAQEQDTTKVSDLEAAQGTAAEAVAAKRELQTGGIDRGALETAIASTFPPNAYVMMPRYDEEKGGYVNPLTGEVKSEKEIAEQYGLNIEDFTSQSELVDGSAVDQTKVEEVFGTGEVQAASMRDELEELDKEFQGGNVPLWAASKVRQAKAIMAARGLSASSMAGQAVIQATMEASLPIAQVDTANKQQMALLAAEQRAKFLQMDFDQEFQAKVMNAAKVSEVANMNFTAEQQVALENAKMAQTMNLANLNNNQALVMAEAAQLSQLEMASLSNRQQAQVQNAQNFLQIDMANLNNEQQTEIFKAQTIANTILSDTAATNASEQFNASSENQTEQFFATLKSQISQFNSAQTNAMSQFNAGEANAIQKFNSELQNQREIFNSQMYAQIAQANAKWRQDTTTINNAAVNSSNFQFAKDVNGLTNKAIDEIWQRERDLMSFAFTSSESAMERTTRLLLGDKSLEGIRIQADAQEGVAKTSFFARLLFGNKGLNIFGEGGLLNLGGS